MKIILFCDLDGTLVSHHSYKVNDVNVSTIHNFVKKENKFVIATGRWINRFIPIAETLNSENVDSVRYAISLSGACVYDLKESRVIKEFSIDQNTFIKLKKLMLLNKIPGLLYSDDSFTKQIVYAFKLKNKWILSKFAGNLKFVSLDYDHKVNNPYKIVIPVLSKNQRAKILKLLSPVKDLLNFIVHNYYIEIIAKNANKAVAAEFLYNYLKLENYIKAAIGDSPNDLDLLNYVNRSFIVSKNPHNSLLEHTNLPIIINKNYLAVHKILNLLMKEQEGSSSND